MLVKKTVTKKTLVRPKPRTVPMTGPIERLRLNAVADHGWRTISGYRIQSQNLDTNYPHIWYDLKQADEIFEHTHLDDVIRVMKALKESSTKLRYRIVALMEVAL